jgi:hypothetical protein
MCFAVPVVLNHLARTRAVRVPVILVAVLGATAIATFAIRIAGSSTSVIYDEVRNHVALLMIVLGIGLVAAVALLKVQSPKLSSGIAAGLFGMTAFLSLTPARYLGINETGEFSPNSRDERLAYAAAYKMTNLLEHWDAPNSRTLLWTPLTGRAMIAWTDLPHQGGAIENVEAPPSDLGDLTRQELDLIRYPTTGELLLLSEAPLDVQRGIAALRRKRAHPAIRRQGTWVDGRLHYALVSVMTPTP